MTGKKPITALERRHQDYLRRNVLRVASVYEVRLAKDRRRELRRVLALAKDYTDPIAIVPLIDGQIDETQYLGKWWQGLVTTAGLPMAKATARDLRAAKAAGEDDVWLTSLRNYATQRAGQEIAVVSGTWKDSLVRIVRDVLSSEVGVGIEKLTREIYDRYTGTLERWQCRRIAQTEAMIGAAEAANEAAQTLSIHYTKQWCISGLGNTRESHEEVDGTEVDEDEPFVLPGGLLMYPHDTSMGADASEIINCACACIRRPKDGSRTAPEPRTKPVVQPIMTPAKPTVIPLSAAEKRVQKFIKELDPALPEATRKAIAENEIALEKELKIKKGKPMSIEKADTKHANPKHGSEYQYSINCATCAPTYVLRARGFDITARGYNETSLNKLVSQARSFDLWKNPDGTPAVPTRATKWMEGKGYKKFTPKRYQEFLEENCKEQGTYICTIRWKGGDGHATVLQRGKDGKLFRIEPQWYSEDRGAKWDISTLYDNANGNQGRTRGVLRVDDKIFDTSWVRLFRTK